MATAVTADRSEETNEQELNWYNLSYNLWNVLKRSQWAPHILPVTKPRHVFIVYKVQFISKLLIF